MPHYHFDVRDAEAFVKDDEGSDLPDIAIDQKLLTFPRFGQRLTLQGAEPVTRQDHFSH